MKVCSNQLEMFSTFYRNNFHWHDNNQLLLDSVWNSKHQSIRKQIDSSIIDFIVFTCDRAISNIGDNERTPWNNGIQSTKFKYDEESGSPFVEFIRLLNKTPLTANSGYFAR